VDSSQLNNTKKKKMATLTERVGVSKAAGVVAVNECLDSSTISDTVTARRTARMCMYS
jgi:hypothetical protein